MTELENLYSLYGADDAQLFGLLHRLWRELQQPDIVWQLLALGLSLGIGWWCSRRFRQHEKSRLDLELNARSALHTFGSNSLKRLAFPLISLVLVLLSGRILRHWGHASLLELSVPLLLSLALVRATFYVLRHAFPPSSWLASSERLIALTIWFGLALYITGLSDSLIELLEQITFRVGKQRLDLWTLLHGAVTILSALLIALWLSGLLEARLLRAEQIDPNLRVVLARLAKAFLLVIGLFFSLSMVGIDITALSVFGGALAVGLGLGLQKMASNYVSGFMILLDRSIRIGSVISLDPSNAGVVTKITTRYTVLRTPLGTELIIPNEHLIGNIVHNQSYTDTRVGLSTLVQVSYQTDVEFAMQLMENAAKMQPSVLSDPPPKALLKEFAENGIVLELIFWVNDTQGRSAPSRSLINLAIWQAFREHGVEIPYPQREVTLRGAAALSAASAARKFESAARSPVPPAN
ncbi:MAG: mechanosensitive ion channel domain-containing protein [Pseudomonadota bacterium]